MAIAWCAYFDFQLCFIILSTWIGVVEYPRFYGEKVHLMDGDRIRGGFSAFVRSCFLPDGLARFLHFDWQEFAEL